MTAALPAVVPRRAERRLAGAMLALSLGAHAALFAGAGRFHETRRPPTTVTLEVAPPRPRVAPPAEEPPRAALPPPPPSRARRAAVARAAPPRPAAAPEPAAPPAPEAPVDLTGVTLTSEASGGWASAAGNGAAMRGPLPAYRGRPRAAAPVSGARGSGDDPHVVELADLARRPEPPALTGELERAYPTDARRAGLSGEAVVRARVRPDGAVDRARVVSATGSSFGDACRRVLVASRWSPPVDRDGAPCATQIRYVCHFEVAR